MNLLELFFNKFFFKDKFDWHVIQAISYSLKLTYELLKLKWDGAQKPPTFSNVHSLYIAEGYKKLHVL